MIYIRNDYSKREQLEARSEGLESAINYATNLYDEMDMLGNYYDGAREHLEDWLSELRADQDRTEEELDAMDRRELREMDREYQRAVI